MYILPMSEFLHMYIDRSCPPHRVLNNTVIQYSVSSPLHFQLPATISTFFVPVRCSFLLLSVLELYEDTGQGLRRQATSSQSQVKPMQPSLKCVISK